MKLLLILEYFFQYYFSIKSVTRSDSKNELKFLTLEWEVSYIYIYKQKAVSCYGMYCQITQTIIILIVLSVFISHN